MNERYIANIKKYGKETFRLVDGDHRESLMKKRLESRRKKFKDMKYRLVKNGDMWLIYGKRK